MMKTAQTDIIIEAMEKILADAKAGRIIFTEYRQSDVVDYGGNLIVRSGEVSWGVIDS